MTTDMPVGRGEILGVRGLNFSGRTDVIRSHLDRLPSPAYIGPEVYNVISGLSETVGEELALFATSDSDAAAAVDLFVLGPHLQKNPYLLSGGEQVIVAAACALVQGVGAIGFDCCLEQLDRSYQRVLLKALSMDQFGLPSCLLADNEAVTLDFSHRVIDAAPPTTAMGLAIRPLNLEWVLTRPPVAADPIHIDQLAFSYTPGAPVFTGISCELAPGRVYLLEGPNGAGKSTLAKLLCGALSAQRGRIRIGSRGAEPRVRPGRFVGYHFQNPDVQLCEITAFDELYRASRTLGYDRRIADQDSRGMLQAFGLADLQTTHPFDLPFVLRKRLAMASSLIGRQPWLVLDEPTLGQDEPTRQALAVMINGLAALGHGIIVITHSQSFRSRLQATTISLRRGRLELGNGAA